MHIDVPLILQLTSSRSLDDRENSSVDLTLIRREFCPSMVTLADSFLRFESIRACEISFDSDFSIDDNRRPPRTQRYRLCYGVHIIISVCIICAFPRLCSSGALVVPYYEIPQGAAPSPLSSARRPSGIPGVRAVCRLGATTIARGRMTENAGKT